MHHLFFPHTRVHRSKKLHHQVAWTSVLLICYPGVLATKTVFSKDLSSLAEARLLHAESDNLRGSKRDTRTTAKKVDNGDSGTFLLTYSCS